MDPNLFYLDWNRTLEVLVTIIVLAFVIRTTFRNIALRHGLRTNRDVAIAMLVLCVSAAGCTQSPQLVGDGSYAADTSNAYYENRVFYLGQSEYWPTTTPEQTTSKDSLHPCETLQVRRLNPAFAPPANVADAIKHGDPLSILVNGVRLPQTIDAPLDVAVVLDIMTGASTDEQKMSLVVWYQRNVRGGATLQFQNILVYSDESWDSDYPPMFRIRALDVRTERNSVTGSLLDSGSQFVNSISGVLPTPSMPGINLAMKAARLILANQRNKVIIDYTVQFYSLPFVDAAGKRSDIASLQRGAWMVVGLPSGHQSKFWRTPLLYDQRTEELLNGCTLSQAVAISGVQSPYVTMSVVPYSARVYAIVQQRSEALFKLLTNGGKTDLSQATKLGEDVAKSVRTFVLLKTLRSDRSIDAVDDIVTSLKDSLNDVDGDALKNELKRLLPKEGKDALEKGDLENWWNGNKGKLFFDKEKYQLIKTSESDSHG